jgi:hypothetical protein
MPQKSPYSTVSFLVIGLALVIAGHPQRAVAQEDVITRGEALGNSRVVDLSDAISAPDEYSEMIVVVEGAVKKVCQMMGCWMELVPAGETAGIRVTFKDYGFFVPKDSAGFAARLEGVFEQNVFSKEDADHLIAEGVTLTRNADGTATELSFVAQGVELRRVS